MKNKILLNLYSLYVGVEGIITTSWKRGCSFGFAPLRPLFYLFPRNTNFLLPRQPPKAESLVARKNSKTTSTSPFKPTPTTSFLPFPSTCLFFPRLHLNSKNSFIKSPSAPHDNTHCSFALTELSIASRHLSSAPSCLSLPRTPSWGLLHLSDFLSSPLSQRTALWSPRASIGARSAPTCDSPHFHPCCGVEIGREYTDYFYLNFYLPTSCCFNTLFSPRGGRAGTE